jgi:hypothetical protein
MSDEVGETTPELIESLRAILSTLEEDTLAAPEDPLSFLKSSAASKNRKASPPTIY